VRALVAAGAVVRVTDCKQRETPLTIAAWNGHVAVVRALLGVGAAGTYTRPLSSSS